MQNHGHFSVLQTADGSPSLRGETEPMHHLGGAYSETQYIYGEALRRLAEHKELVSWNVLVVGLGLGYIELLSVAEALKHQKKIHLLTYEIEAELVDLFIHWLKGDVENKVYDQMLNFFKEDYPAYDLKKELFEIYLQGEWEIRGALDSSSLPSPKYQLILFDAFSGKTTPNLWTEDFLNVFLMKTVGSSLPAVFSTYACTGVLKRVLHQAGFKVEKRRGFLGKRNSTLAYKQVLDSQH